MSRQQKNAFTMHSNAQLMLSKTAVTMPIGSGAFGVSMDRKQLIHLFINLIYSL